MFGAGRREEEGGVDADAALRGDGGDGSKTPNLNSKRVSMYSV